MGAYGAPTAKPTRLFANDPVISSLKKTLPKNFTGKHKTTSIDTAKRAAGLPAVTGRRHELHVTQEYPWAYGTAVKDCLESVRGGPVDVEESDEDSASTVSDPADLWHDALSDDIANFMNVPCDRMRV